MEAKRTQQAAANLNNKRVVVMGLGRFGGGVGVARFLVNQGANVLVTDQLQPNQLEKSIAQLARLPIEYRLGEHCVNDFTTADLIVVNPAVKPAGNPYLEAAIKAGVPLTSEIRLLVSRLPNRKHVIGITGSAGKSTITAMIGHVLNQLKKANAPSLVNSNIYVGGNIGGSLLEHLENITHDDWIVLELSSFMLEGLNEDHWSPHIALITNFAPNHLDWHETVESYRNAKQVLIAHQYDEDIALLGPGADEHFTAAVNHVVSLTDEQIDDAIKTMPPLMLPGKHNQLNAIMALAAIEATGLIDSDESKAQSGFDRATVLDVIASFPGLPHRLQFVCERAGVRYFNDSKCTTPEAAQLAIESFPASKVHVVLGGYDKGANFAPLLDAAVKHCFAIYTIGSTGDSLASQANKICQTLSESQVQPKQQCSAQPLASIINCQTLERAIEATASRVRAGDVVLLSPGSASWDQFENFEQRGNAFAQAVLDCTGEGAPAPAPANHNTGNQ
jgi:UDP-N-acetylmuramoylalanine--D-glutamate ligase